MKRLGFGLTVSSTYGSGTLALNLALQSTQRTCHVTLSDVASDLELDPLRLRLLAPALQECAGAGEGSGAKSAADPALPFLWRLGDRLDGVQSARRADGATDIGLVASEHTDINAVTLAAAATWPLLIAGSEWSARALREHGLANVVACPPGVDLSLYHPASRAALFPGRYVIFSGGPLSYQKGHDIVVAAVAVFLKRHPETLLLCAWAGSNDDDRDDLKHSPHLGANPRPAKGEQLARWLQRHGVPSSALYDLGNIQSRHIPGILRECDLALFPSRCEAAVNARAMEAMACAIPTIVSANTGHLELLGEHAYVLAKQGDVAALRRESGKRGWGESSLEDLLAAMEDAYAHRAKAAEKGRAAARFMMAWSWDIRAAALFEAVSNTLQGHPAPLPSVEQDYNWGLSLHRAGRLTQALTVYDTVLETAPGYLAALGDRGNVRRDLGDLDGAERDFRQVLLLKPEHRLAAHSLGRLLRLQGKLPEAAVYLRQATTGVPKPSAHWDLAFALLQMGEYAQAWPHFDYRHDALGLRKAHASTQRWDGTVVTGQTLLVLDEQGLGDTLQFLRFLERIPKGMGGRVIFAGKAATLPVVRQVLAPADVFNWDQALPAAQLWAPLMALPGLLGVERPEQLPAPLGRCIISPERAARWRDAVRGPGNAPVVGLCWRGNPDFKDDAIRSPGLATLLPVLQLEGLRFVSLQVGPGRNEIDALGLSGRLHDLGGAVQEAGSQILDTLAVLSHCDFVISSCTSVAHMAGLIGRPGRIMLSCRPDWRWMLLRADTPWYPSLQLVRQQTLNDWDSVVEEIVQQLGESPSWSMLAPATLS